MANNNSFLSLFAEQLNNQTYKESWNQAGEAFSLKDGMPEVYAQTTKAVVTERDQVHVEGETFHSRSICLFLGTNGDVKYLSLSPRSALSAGDEVDIDTIQITPLTRTGAAPIFKADGMLKM